MKKQETLKHKNGIRSNIVVRKRGKDAHLLMK